MRPWAVLLLLPWLVARPAGPAPKPDALPAVEPGPVPAPDPRIRHDLSPRDDSPLLYSSRPGQEAASPFTLTKPTAVRRLIWHGHGTGEVEFVVRFLPSREGVPSEPAAWERTVKLRGVPSGVKLDLPGKPGDGVEVLRYELDLPDGPLLAAGTEHWLSVVAMGTNRWMWARGEADGPGLATRSSLSGTPWKSRARTGRAAFRLEGPAEPPAKANVP